MTIAGTMILREPTHTMSQAMMMTQSMKLSMAIQMPIGILTNFKLLTYVQIDSLNIGEQKKIKKITVEVTF